MHDLKDFHQNWWDRKVILGITWNHIIVAMVGIALFMTYNSLDWDRILGIR